MNIFKILANGDGSINEANISAFLAYLLDPNADHTMQYEFLDQFLEVVFEGEKFTTEKYEYEVYLEQAFKEEDKSKKKVDIVIICYSTELGNSKESLVKRFLEDKQKEIHKIIIIENKIRASSKTTGQLLDQFNSTKHELDDSFSDKIHSVYLTPHHDSLVQEFNEAQLVKSKHIFWKAKDKNIIDVFGILGNIILKESHGLIDPISPYTVQTLKAFCKFIENEFKSEKQERKEKAYDYTYTNECISLNKESDIEAKLTELRSEILIHIPNINISHPIMKRICEPELKVSYKNIGISLYAGHKSRDTVMPLFSIIRESAVVSKSALITLAKKLKVEVKKPNSKNGAYCKVDILTKRIKLNEVSNIVVSIKKAMELIDR